jgi:hypothetical protein
MCQDRIYSQTIVRDQQFVRHLGIVCVAIGPYWLQNYPLIPRSINH